MPAPLPFSRRPRPIALVRGRIGARDGGLLDQYVNDRPYAGNSFLARDLAGLRKRAERRSEERAELADTPIPLVARIPLSRVEAVPVSSSGCHAPCYEVEASRQPVDPGRPEWGDSTYYNVALSATARLQDLLLTSTCSFRCSTTTSTTGSAETRSTSF